MSSSEFGTDGVPLSWYNICADLGFALPSDLSSSQSTKTADRLRIPMSLLRQERSRARWIPIPEDVVDKYRQWRPTPLRRARALEDALETSCRLYYKYEGGNVSGSHKLNTAVAQAYFYRRAGRRRLTVGTGAGQWGTAIAAACAMFGLDCRVFMVRSSYEAKPHRKTMMELFGAEVVPSPSGSTEYGRRSLASGSDTGGSLGVALAEAVEDGMAPHSAFCAGSGETYALLHQSVIGLETHMQLEELEDRADVVVGSLGAGSNLGGIALPFLGSSLRGGPKLRVVSVEPAACPKLTRGRYAYDYTDASETSPLQKMYTLGHAFAPPTMHAAGLRYHGTSKLISALYARNYLEAVAYPQKAVFESAEIFARAEGIIPAPESAHAIHGARLIAAAADRNGDPRTIVICLSGHGLLDLGAYDAFHSGEMTDVDVSDEQIESSLAALPARRFRER